MTEAGEVALSYARRILALNDEFVETMQVLTSRGIFASAVRWTSPRSCLLFFPTSHRSTRKCRSNSVLRVTRLWPRRLKGRRLTSPLSLVTKNVPRRGRLGNSMSSGLLPPASRHRQVNPYRSPLLARSASSAGVRYSISKARTYLTVSPPTVPALTVFGLHCLVASASRHAPRSTFLKVSYPQGRSTIFLRWDACPSH